jgi:hypothetical protein
MILRVYAGESKRITFSHRITSLRESAPTENQDQLELYQTGPKKFTLAQIYLKNRFCSSKKPDSISICFGLDAFVKPSWKVIYELQRWKLTLSKSFYLFFFCIYI